MDLPPVGVGGQRITVNTGLDADSTLWHFRSAWNVAALNCLDPGYESILEGYSAFLKQNVRTLASTNTAIEERFRKQYGARNAAVKARETYMTQVYNYFALPPARARFCDVARSFSQQYLSLSPTPDIKQFAAANLPNVETVYQDFFREYEKYQADSASWDAQYGTRYGASQPGYVAVHGASGQSVGALVNLNAPAQQTGAVVDPQSGAEIPVIPVPDEVSTPVVQPVPSK
jgi:hypothetical protein